MESYRGKYKYATIFDPFQRKIGLLNPFVRGKKLDAFMNNNLMLL